MRSAKSEQAPLFDMLVDHSKKDLVPFHVPGHKQRAVVNDDKEAADFGILMTIDVTELSDTDDLHDPSGAIAQAHNLAAACFGAEETRFLVGGSTAGNLAMILGVCDPGDIVLVQRNVHKSIIHGLALAGAQCVFLTPVLDGRSGIAIAPGVETVEEAVKIYGEAKALILCSPNYYGLTADLAPLVEAAHAKRMPVLVDEAHGAHFGLHPAFPRSALQAGADVVVQSTHKMLGSLTMSAMLHMQGELAPRPAIRQALRMIQSSSPSYPLMASLDLARREIQVQGHAYFLTALAVSRTVRKALAELPFEALNADDPLKLSIRNKQGRLSGFELQAELEKRGCVAEMADASYTVLALGPGTRKEDGEILLHALSEIAKALNAEDLHIAATAGTTETSRNQATRIQVSEPVTIKRRIASTSSVALEAAAGHICGEWIIPYPPGIPLLYPGEPISEAIVGELRRLAAAGARFQGASDESLATIRVLTEGDIHERGSIV
ncbi:aminotransferase class I/II-fold pyridoxal phosphate-dependent enzyme [Cohnella sp. GCM10012308]|uniref:aminotransferase class I/II-fold pyridoxal phosphate-dependent enzyme n=1 Tax=Cohnella sp. GCM10012308 TaxID=3317329 RepID=UPI00361207D7